MSDKRLEGVFAPIVTVFDANEEIVLADIVSNIHYYNNTKLAGYMPLGSNGEFQGLTQTESIMVLDAICETRTEGKVIVGGCGRESVHKTVEFIRLAAAHGLNYAFVLPPHYFVSRMTDEALYLYYMRVADGSPAPIVIYNAPKFSSGLDLSPELIARIAEHENIVAIKNSSDRPNAQYIQALEGKDMVVIAGNIGSFYPGLCDGAIGGVLSTATYMTEYCCKLYELFMAGKRDEAEALHRWLGQLSADTIGRWGVAGVKLGLTLRGLSGGHVRLPLLDVPEAEAARIKAYFEAYPVPPAVL